MKPELITAIATLATVVVIGASAIAALIQLRHMRASNELEAVLALQREFRSPELQAALEYVQQQLPSRLDEEGYRAELAAVGYVGIERHPELLVCNWFTQMGTFLKRGLIGEPTLMDLYARLVRHYWTILAPAIAIMRRHRGEGQYSDFEFLALRAGAWLAHYSEGAFPARVARPELPDPWRALDASPESPR